MSAGAPAVRPRRSGGVLRLMAPLRRLGLDLLARGASHSEVMRELGVSRPTVWKWARAAAGGVPDAAPAAQQLGPLARARLPALIEGGARVHGFPTDGWTMARLTVMIELEFGLVLSTLQVFHLLGDAVPRPASTRAPAQHGLVEKAGRAAGVGGAHVDRVGVQRCAGLVEYRAGAVLA